MPGPAGASQTLTLHQPFPALRCVGHSGGTEESPFLMGSDFHGLANYDQQTNTCTDTQHRCKPISLHPSPVEEALSATQQPTLYNIPQGVAIFTQQVDCRSWPHICIHWGSLGKLSTPRPQLNQNVFPGWEGWWIGAPTPLFLKSSLGDFNKQSLIQHTEWGQRLTVHPSWLEWELYSAPAVGQWASQCHFLSLGCYVCAVGRLTTCLTECHRDYTKV